MPGGWSQILRLFQCQPRHGRVIAIPHITEATVSCLLRHAPDLLVAEAVSLPIALFLLRPFQFN